MKVIEPTPLLREAAGVLEPVVDDVVVIGAVAVVVALDRSSTKTVLGATRDIDVVAIAPTRDIDIAVSQATAPGVVSKLLRMGLEPSDEPGERGFTWQRGDLKVQLMSPASGPRMGGGLRLPVQPALGIVNSHHLDVAFHDTPTVRRLRCATAGALVALKRAAFGRRAHDGKPVDRDYHDVFQLLMGARRDLLEEASAGDYTIRTTVEAAAEALAAGDDATIAAAHERVSLGLDRTPATAQRAVRRGSISFLRELQARNAQP